MIHDVLIAGAGPVGLWLACELRLAGVGVLVLEQAQDPDSPLKHAPFGLRGLSVPTVEALYRRGLLDAVAQAAGPGPAPGRQGGHFAGIAFDPADVDRARWPYRLANPADATLPVTMASLETVLAARARSLGARILRGRRVHDLLQSDEGVSVQAGGETFRGRWLVGCDGGRSQVRKLAGMAFEGTEPEFTGYSIQVDIAEADGLGLGRHYTPAGMYFQSRPGTIAMAWFDGGASHRARTLTLEHVQAVLRQVSGTGVTLRALHQVATWTDRARQAPSYRQGRVLLAGDAAHVHSPLGGQGLNLGLGDAMNLGWKLAATIRGDAPPDLLDSYTIERHPPGAQVLAWSRAQVALMRPEPASRALAAIMRDLLATRDGATHFAERLWGVTQRCALDGHPLAGRSAPDFSWPDGTRLGARMHDGAGWLLDFTASATLRATAARWRGRIRYVAGAPTESLGLRAVLVRPDGVVAWAAEDESDFVELAACAGRWFGRPDDASLRGDSDTQ